MGTRLSKLGIKSKWNYFKQDIILAAVKKSCGTLKSNNIYQKKQLDHKNTINVDKCGPKFCQNKKKIQKQELFYSYFKTAKLEETTKTTKDKV